MIVSTFPNLDEAKKIVLELLKEHLIACANITPEIQSFYWWKNTIQEDIECIAFIKTRKELEKEVMDRIKDMHSYEVPAIYAIESMNNISETYLEWIKDVTKT